MSDSPTIRLPTLPTEVILQIFQEDCYNDADLANLALVSRRFLSTVQTTLYQSNYICSYHRRHLSENPPNDDGEESPQDLYYDQSVVSYLRTLEENPRLASLVRLIKFDHDVVESTDGMFNSAKPSPSLLIQELLQHATNLNELILEEDFLDMAPTDIWSNFKQDGDKIKTLSVFAILQRGEVRAIVETFPSLTTLAVSGFQIDRPRRRRRFRLPLSPVLAHLENLSVVGAQQEGLHIPFIGPSLRSLHINVLTAAGLDFSRCPGLKHLEMDYRSGFEEDRGDFDNEPGEFWKCIQSCPNFETLSIIGPERLDNDEVREDWGYVNKGLFERAITAGVSIHLPKLRKIVFRGGVFLEQIALCLELDIKPQLIEVELIIFHCFLRKSDVPIRKALLKAARTLCEAKGIKLTAIVNGTVTM